MKTNQNILKSKPWTYAHHEASMQSILSSICVMACKKNKKTQFPRITEPLNDHLSCVIMCENKGYTHFLCLSDSLHSEKSEWLIFHWWLGCNCSLRSVWTMYFHHNAVQMFLKACRSALVNLNVWFLVHKVSIGPRLFQWGNSKASGVMHYHKKDSLAWKYSNYCYHCRNSAGFKVIMRHFSWSVEHNLWFCSESGIKESSAVKKNTQKNPLLQDWFHLNITTLSYQFAASMMQIGSMACMLLQNSPTGF